MGQGGDRSSTANVMCESRRDGANFLLGVRFKNLTRSSVEGSTYCIVGMQLFCSSISYSLDPIVIVIVGSFQFWFDNLNLLRQKAVYC